MKDLKTALVPLHHNIYSFSFQHLLKALFLYFLSIVKNLYGLKIIRNSVDLVLHETSSCLSLTSNPLPSSFLLFSFVPFGAGNA